jgi:translation initiation factor IF-2
MPIGPQVVQKPVASPLARGPGAAPPAPAPKVPGAPAVRGVGGTVGFGGSPVPGASPAPAATPAPAARGTGAVPTLPVSTPAPAAPIPQAPAPAPAAPIQKTPAPDPAVPVMDRVQQPGPAPAWMSALTDMTKPASPDKQAAYEAFVARGGVGGDVMGMGNESRPGGRPVVDQGFGGPGGFAPRTTPGFNPFTMQGPGGPGGRGGRGGRPFPGSSFPPKYGPPMTRQPNPFDLRMNDITPRRDPWPTAGGISHAGGF